MTDQPDSAFATITVKRGVLTATVHTESIGSREALTILGDVDDRLNRMTGIRQLVLDVTEVEFMGSMGVGMCVNLRNRALARGAVQVFVVGLRPAIREVFTLMRLAGRFTIVNRREQLPDAMSSS